MALRTFLLLFLPLFAHAQGGNNSRQHALLLGISEYPQSEACHWSKLNGGNQVDSLQSILIARGFLPDHIATVRNEQATKAGMIASFQQLTQTVQRASIVLVYFSMHGQQIPDNNGDEITDHADESLIPYDCPHYDTIGKSCLFPADYSGNQHLRDDEIGQLLHNLREKIGPEGEVMVLMDGCHTGTGTRSIRAGNNKRFISNVEPVFTESGTDRTTLAPMICFFAQLPALETIDNVFSESVCKALKGSGSETTYEAFFEAVKAGIDDQYVVPNPEDMDDLYKKSILGGELQGWKDRISVKQWLDGSRLRIGWGTFSNVFKGTQLDFFDRSGSKIATGTVDNASGEEASVLLKPAILEEERVGVWGRIVKWVISDNPMLVRNELTTDNLQKAIQKAVVDNPNFILDDGVDGIRIYENSQSILLYHGPDSLTHFTKNKYPPDYTVDAILRFLLQYQRQVTLSKLNYKSALVRVDWKLIPVDIDGQPTGKAFERNVETGQIVMQENTYFGVEITNTSEKEVFFALLDFPSTQHPDLAKTILIPDSKTTATDYSLKPKQTIVLKQHWKITPPYGKETLKLITSTKPLQNLQQAVKTRSITTTAEAPISSADEYDVSDIFLDVIKIKDSKR